MNWLTEWAFHLHLLMAISWIGGSVFMFILGVTLRDKKAQQSVYPYVGPIFGWFEVGSLIILLATGFILGYQYHLFSLLLHPNGSEVSQALVKKAILVAILTVATVVHFVIAYRTNGKERTKWQHFFSRGSSMLIFFLNLFVMHYAIVLRDIL
ncbi:hypothetical protein [Nitratifractor salsuginis]|uniref:DUF4149 domain-containing protein n=1 Tax=Nitratifractor salsuginis (strain DSM 16511 / JCM 12458 / E9I37-1) TaxID=749222 RepID=E6WYH2_NITSE|nr:hypothetical protein [Nitratifractor salsuginis]ADV46484.1 hypothetical protein Nitsa_1231 [Nitratifractor salsuginis DSM 16511]